MMMKSALGKVAKLCAALAFLIWLIGSESLYAQSRSEDFTQLEHALEKIVEEGGVDAVGIAVVDTDGSSWVRGFGSIQKHPLRKASEDTLFRIGSVSKIFIGLAILKLQEEGRLSLNDTISDLVPEIEFKNKWKSSHPILVAHLLEHTTGWDDFQGPEWLLQDSSISLKDALDFHPHSRRSRWIPGTRFAYSNVGPSVAAYIVEKLSGQTFEKYAQTNFFDVLGMEGATYFFNESLAIEDYQHLCMRPIGSINASANDMLPLLEFFVNRGIGFESMISSTSLERMETSVTSLRSKVGFEFDLHGLSNQRNYYKGHRYQGHGGSLNGFKSELAYFPELRSGYVILLRYPSWRAVGRIENLVRDFVTRNSNSKSNIEEYRLNRVTPNPRHVGFYQWVNPRNGMQLVAGQLTTIYRIVVEDQSVYLRELTGKNKRELIPVSENQYRASETGLLEVAVVNDPLIGEALLFGPLTLEKVSGVIVYGRLVILALWILFSVSSVLLFPFWAWPLINKKLSSGKTIRIRLWPFVASLIAILGIGLMQVSSFERLYSVSFVSVAVMLSSILFSFCSVYSIYNVIKFRLENMNRYAYWHSAILASLHVCVTFYLTTNGVVGIRLWA